MVKIRLKRIGAKKAPAYRIVIADSRSPRDGRFIEQIGFYNPLTNPAEIKIDAEKAKTWLGRFCYRFRTGIDALVGTGHRACEHRGIITLGRISCAYLIRIHKIRYCRHKVFTCECRGNIAAVCTAHAVTDDTERTVNVFPAADHKAVLIVLTAFSDICFAV